MVAHRTADHLVTRRFSGVAPRSCHGEDIHSPAGFRDRLQVQLISLVQPLRYGAPVPPRGGCRRNQCAKGQVGVCQSASEEDKQPRCRVSPRELRNVHGVLTLPLLPGARDETASKTPPPCPLCTTSLPRGGRPKRRPPSGLSSISARTTGRPVEKGGNTALSRGVGARRRTLRCRRPQACPVHEAARLRPRQGSSSSRVSWRREPSWPRGRQGCEQRRPNPPRGSSLTEGRLRPRYKYLGFCHRLNLPSSPPSMSTAIVCVKGTRDTTAPE